MDLIQRKLYKHLTKMETDPTITHIKWAEYYMTRSDMDRFMTLLQSRPQAVSLTYLGCDGMFQGMISKILCALLTHHNLETLELFDHNIGGEGLLAIAKFLLETKTLKICRLIPGPSYRRPDAHNIDPKIAAEFRDALTTISGQIKFEGPSFLGGADQDIFSYNPFVDQDDADQD